MKRVFDIFLGCVAYLIFFLQVLLVAIAVRLTYKAHVLYWFDRIGRNNVIFKIPKFCSIRVSTPTVDTHLLANASSHLTLNRAEMRRVRHLARHLHRRAEAMHVNLGLQTLLLSRVEEALFA
jgi:lipopolysaccharide/colanic/teichoic acid biosynthesis glycosyltransferase